MADKTFEPEDPMERIAHAFPVSDPVEHDARIARTFIEEFALMGWSSTRIGELYRSPEYVGCHEIYQRRGAEFVDHLIAGVFGVPTDV